MKSKVMFFVGIPVLAIIVTFSIFLFYGKEETLDLVITDIDLSKVSDGTYTGSYSKGRFSYKVKVVVKNNMIENVSIIDKPIISLEDIPKKIIGRVLERQSLNVDIVTGATATSKSILKAIENALNK
ncbi:FMN-binding protein [bacterium]|nr:FMN-binding protein [bacterium]